MAGGGVTLIGTCVRGGEVRRGVKAVVGVAVGVFVGLASGGLAVAGGGSAPEKSGCSATVAPPIPTPAATSAVAMRRPLRSHSTPDQIAPPRSPPRTSLSFGRSLRCCSAASLFSSRTASSPSAIFFSSCSISSGITPCYYGNTFPGRPYGPPDCYDQIPV